VPARHIASDKTKYPALFCACRYDRASSGATLVQPWTYVPPANITFTSAGSGLDGDQDSSNVTLLDILAVAEFNPPSFGAGASMNISSRMPMTWYRSSHDSTRTFCSVCGATAFYLNDGRPLRANVAVGILRADEGTLARNWLEWAWGPRRLS